MTDFKNWLGCLVILLCGGVSAAAFTSSNAATNFDAYNNAFLVSGYYAGWWTGAEEIEMAEDAFDNLPTAARQTIVSNACNQFIAHNGSNWISGNQFDKYNDDVSWAVIAFSRGYQITGNTMFRDVAKFNWDGMYSRAWDTNFTGGGLWWNTDNTYKNAAVNGPAAIAACLLYKIYGDSSYLTRAQAIYAWERRVLLNLNNGSIADGINLGSTTTSGGSLTYNQGTFIGAANLLYRATGLPIYYQDAIVVGKYTQNSMTSGGILPQYGSNSDLSGFNGIFARWMARFAKDQNLWPAFGPWLTTNANAAWNVRNANNLSWQKWATALGTNIPDSWGCSASVVIMQVADTSPLDTLQITPAAGFTTVTQPSLLPNPINTILTLTNTDVTSLNWSLVNTSSWLNVSASSGTLPAHGSANITVSLIAFATTNMPAGRYITSIRLTNFTSGVISTRWFTLVIAGGDAPIALTGYNVGILAPNTATAGTPQATAFDVANNYCFNQAGLNGSTRGLPPDGVFTSQLDATTVFQFQPYGSNNALELGNALPSSATLTLTTPQAYQSISILATSANGGGLGTFVLNFTNGFHSQVFTFNAQDWFATSANAAIQGFGRLKLGGSWNPEDNGPVNPNLYQTTLNLAALGLNQNLASITFTKPAGAAASAVFAVSGTLAYHEPVITQQPAPANRYRFTGSTNTLTVVANAGLPVNYSWCLNGTTIPNATSATFQQTNLQTNDSGNYSVVISNAFGVVTSSIVSLTVAPAPTYPFGQVVLADGAVGYWRLDETSGATAHDSVAGDDGTYTPKVLLGQPGNNLLDTHKVARFGVLAATDSCVTNIGVDFAKAGNVAFTVEAWVNGGSQSTDAGLVTRGYGSGGEQFNLDCGGGSGSHAFRFFVRDAVGGSAHVASSTVVPNNQWHHLVGVCDEANSNVFLYVDGVKTGTTTITPNTGLLYAAVPMSIGSRQAGAGTAYNNQFVGYIEEVAVYNYALTANQVLAHFQSVSNRPPAFVANPFAGADANAGQFYSATLTTYASDPNGDAITFVKISGPAWLSIASNGSLSGTPLSVNAGMNHFMVRATDPSGLFSTATMNVMVSAAPSIVTSAGLSGNNLVLNWTGGIAPYQVQTTTNLANPVWENFGAPVNANTLPVPLTNAAAYFRIYGQ